jgi:hypothetical protein
VKQLSLLKGPRQRGVKAPTPSEFEIHCAVADVLRRWTTPGWRWTHIPSGEYRPKPTADRLQRMGLQVAWPDLILLSPIPSRTHFLELKSAKGRLTPFQMSFAEWCHANEVQHAVAYSFKEAIDHLKNWGAVRAVVSA